MYQLAGAAEKELGVGVGRLVRIIEMTLRAEPELGEPALRPGALGDRGGHGARRVAQRPGDPARKPLHPVRYVPGSSSGVVRVLVGVSHVTSLAATMPPGQWQ